MNGHTRRLLYQLAIQTGLRSGELRSLIRSSLMLDADRPYVLLEARQTKHRKAARQYIRPELAAHVARSMPAATIFPMPRRENVAKMIRADLGAARDAWITDAGIDAGERVTRESGEFLRAEDRDGRILDFHALRHTCGAWAAIGGASPKAIQTLMRHSTIELSLGQYGHLLPDEAAETVARMPSVEPIALRLTGTATATANTQEGNAQVTATGAATGAHVRAMHGNSLRNVPIEEIPADPAKQAGNGVFATVREGFEPPDPEGSPVFKTGAFNRSATAPRLSPTPDSTPRTPAPARHRPQSRAEEACGAPGSGQTAPHAHRQRSAPPTPGRTAHAPRHRPCPRAPP